MKSKSILAIGFFLMAWLTACEVNVRGGSDTSLRECPKTLPTDDADSLRLIKTSLAAANYSCVAELFGLAERLNYKPAFGEEARLLVDRLKSDSTNWKPSESKAVLSAISYLSLNTRGQTLPANSLVDYAGFLRSQLNQTEAIENRLLATNLVSVLKDDKDIPVLVANATSGDESLLAVSLFALIQNCSPTAQIELKKLLNSSQVESYLKKYLEKESITRTLNRDCPAAAPHSGQ